MNGHAKYTIRIVAQMVGMHEQSLRMYERKGLICPQRSDGNIRLFSTQMWSACCLSNGWSMTWA